MGAVSVEIQTLSTRSSHHSAKSIPTVCRAERPQQPMGLNTASRGLALASQLEANGAVSPMQRLTENKSSQTLGNSTQHRTAYYGGQMGRLAVAPATVSVLTVSGAAEFNSGKASSFHSSVSPRRHLYKSLLESALIGGGGDVCVVLTSDVTSPLCGKTVASNAVCVSRRRVSTLTPGGGKETMQGGLQPA
ncbi:hypothetical protein D5F01_LYC16494 [Larimichthys crocea]|uniref:Uncharacterized protein n=1 Tax=Larimichthys crocea TaxID=215358 RepID=A0A6G0I129_LARCR|nr:hypothetical protein D5F01_LYC16494 [Larimichthys crocea]